MLENIEYVTELRIRRPDDCTNTVIATLGINVTVITFDVEENYCGPYDFEGYVQPTCVAEGDPSLQTAWTPICKYSRMCWLHTNLFYSINCKSRYYRLWFRI